MTDRDDPAKYVGLNYHVSDTGERKLFAHIDVSGLTDAQITAVREYAIAMQPRETRQ